eukprot:CAMPEP_0184691746 /NCGR_PEP_ID=MMETSP0313-20130426/493_1 /TAXON_ID=2792 /ORGANISM="Porphyridium aerugineum, Strain SAG 1380-2" /LENGTH=488 /DNA_ID=CAMNT_0027149505 /DNA_START=125 /DNA_END=1591 /DNA_ORIENTATION=+
MKQSWTVLVIGGGFGGLSTCIELSSMIHHYRNTKPTNSIQVIIKLIDPKDFMEWRPSTLKCIVDASYVNTISVEMDHVLKQLNSEWCLVERVIGRVKRLEMNHAWVESMGVAEVEGEGTLVEEKVGFDVCIVATGSRHHGFIQAENKFPVGQGNHDEGQRPRLDVQTLTERYNELELWQEHLDSIQKIVVVGSGFVGVELVAELAERYKTSKQIVLVASGRRVLDRLPPRASKLAEKWLQKHHVHTIFNARMEKVTSADSGTSTKQILRNSKDGQILECDIVFWCTGSTIDTSFVQNSASQLLQQARVARYGNRIAVNAVRQVVSLEPTNSDSGQYQYTTIPHIFALGDVCVDIQEMEAGHGLQEQMAYMAEMQASVVAENVLSLMTQDPRRKLIGFPRHRALSIQDKESVAGRLPYTQVVSLGSRNAIVRFEWLVFGGLLGALVKWIIETLSIWGYRNPRGIARHVLRCLENLSFVLCKLLNVLFGS